MSTEPVKLIGTNQVVFLDESPLNLGDHAVRICGHRKSMPVYAAFHNALSKDIVAEQLELWPVVQFLIMSDPICCELRVISIATGTSVKCYRPKIIPFLQGIPGAIFQLNNARQQCCKDCLRLQFNPAHATSSLTSLFTGYVTY